HQEDRVPKRRFADREMVSLNIHHFDTSPALPDSLSVADRTAQDREVRKGYHKSDHNGPSARGRKVIVKYVAQDDEGDGDQNTVDPETE
ncbi:MAG: hypothetical protein WAU76_11105, partial [Candidatus Sulfotelmatobacter sp.]